jgi:hypothetical protein
LLALLLGLGLGCVQDELIQSRLGEHNVVAKNYVVSVYLVNRKNVNVFEVAKGFVAKVIASI